MVTSLLGVLKGNNGGGPKAPTSNSGRTHGYQSSPTLTGRSVQGQHSPFSCGRVCRRGHMTIQDYYSGSPGESVGKGMTHPVLGSGKMAVRADHQAREGERDAVED